MGGDPRETWQAKLLNTPLSARPLNLHDAGERYDKKVGGGIRHLHVRRAFGTYEVAWEGAPLDEHRLRAGSRVREEAEMELFQLLLKKIGF
jgi:hypothetical protein